MQADNDGDAGSAAPQAALQDPKVARRLIRDMNHFVRSYEPPLASLEVSDQAVVHILWGWWLWMSEQGVVVAQAKTPRRLAAVSPLVRSVSEHVDLMLWLHYRRFDGVMALHRQRQRWQHLLWGDYFKAHGGAPYGVDQPQSPEKPVDERGRRLDAELRHMEKRLASFDAGTPYYVYRSASDVVHANLGTSRFYAPVDDDGSGRCLVEPEEQAVSSLAMAMLPDVAFRCCQASMIINREVADRSLDGHVQAWLQAADIDDVLPALATTHE